MLCWWLHWFVYNINCSVLVFQPLRCKPIIIEQNLSQFIAWNNSLVLFLCFFLKKNGSQSISNGCLSFKLKTQAICLEISSARLIENLCYAYGVLLHIKDSILARPNSSDKKRIVPIHRLVHSCRCFAFVKRSTGWLIPSKVVFDKNGISSSIILKSEHRFKSTLKKIGYKF